MATTSNQRLRGRSLDPWLLPPQTAVEEQQDQRADHGDDEGAQVEAREVAEAEQRGDEAADERAGDAKENSDDEAAGIAARHDQLRGDAGNQAEHDPRENTHETPNQQCRFRYRLTTR